MRDHRFELDDRKAASNLRKHGVSFELARAVFDDPRKIERLDLDEPDGDRYLLTGLAGARLLTVVFVERGTRIRIISARKATMHEQDDYTSSGA
jgi:uncharacterized DUF497 family protein